MGRVQVAVLRSLVRRRVQQQQQQQQRALVLRVPGEQQQQPRSDSEPVAGGASPGLGDGSRSSSSQGGEPEALLTALVKAVVVVPESQAVAPAASRDWSLGSWNAAAAARWLPAAECFSSSNAKTTTTTTRSDFLGLRAFSSVGQQPKGEEQEGAAAAEEAVPTREQGQGGDDGVNASVSDKVKLAKPRRRSSSSNRSRKKGEAPEEIQPAEEEEGGAITTAVKAQRKPRTASAKKLAPVLEETAIVGLKKKEKKKKTPAAAAAASTELGGHLDSSVAHAGSKMKTPAAASSTELGDPHSSVDVSLEEISHKKPDVAAVVQELHNCALEGTEMSGRMLGISDSQIDSFLEKPQTGASPPLVERESVVKRHESSTLTRLQYTEMPKKVAMQLPSADKGLHSSVFTAASRQEGHEIFGEDSIREILENYEYGDLEAPRVAPKFPKANVMRAAKGGGSGGLHTQGESSGNEEEEMVKFPVLLQYSDPQKVFALLHQSKPSSVSSFEKARFSWIFHRFAESGWVSDQALAIYINSKFFPTAVSRFRKFISSRSPPDLRAMLIKMGPTNEALRFLFPVFAEFCINEFATEITRYRDLVSTADLTKPYAWYPFARAMKRKVVYHQGPTNSGKTYVALQRFMQAANGIYCSPLRLLAMEVFDKVNAEGVYCNLHTGQEKKDVPFANHLTCTVEMSYLNCQWEVAVIDEIQMMSDEYRGWAWTRAFLGLQADEIHVCGDPSAVPLLRSLCAATGDELVLYDYERFKPLTIDHGSLNGDFANVEAGDCIVAFSRKDIFDVKREVELATKHRCCVVYGALPPETRRQQAQLFNDPNSGYNVLVASDAVGMGLNLNIRRVVFYSLDKFDGGAKRPVPPSQVKQIAGRAGRRGSLFPEGVTTTFFLKDSDYLSQSMQQGFENATSAGLFPVYEQVELFASQLPEMSLSPLLERFAETCRLDGAYFLCRYDNLKRVASVLDKVKGLSLEDRFNFCFAPVNVRDPQSLGALYRYALAYSQKIPVVVQMGAPVNSARDEFELMDLETRHQVLSMYLWLSQHFREEQFVQKGKAEEMATHIATLLGQSLVQSSGRWHDKRNGPHSRKPSRPQSPPRGGKVAIATRPARPPISKQQQQAKQERMPAAY